MTCILHCTGISKVLTNTGCQLSDFTKCSIINAVVVLHKTGLPVSTTNVLFALQFMTGILQSRARDYRIICWMVDT